MKSLDTFRQQRWMHWLWRFVIVVTLINAVMAAVVGEWRIMFNELVFAMFVYYIDALEKHITLVNEAKTPPDNGFGT